MATNVDIYCNDFKNKLNQSTDETTTSNVFLYLTPARFKVILLALSYVFCHKTSFKKFLFNNPIPNNIKESINDLHLLLSNTVVMCGGVNG